MSKVLWLETLTELDSVLTDNDRVLVLFTAPSWCRPCQKLEPIYAQASEDSETIFVALDVDVVRDVDVEYNIRSVPTMMLFENNAYVRNVPPAQLKSI